MSAVGTRRGLGLWALKALGAVAVVSMVSTGVAFAFWTSTGSASGSASTGSILPVTVAASVGGDSPSSTLLPQGPAADVILRVTNPNARPVTLVSVVGGPGAITGSGGVGTCTTTGVVFANQTGLNVAIAPSGTTFVDLAGAATMAASSDPGCQGATFSIPVTITVHLG